MSQEIQEKPEGNTKTSGSKNQLYVWFLTIPYGEYKLIQISQLFKSIAKKFTFQVERGTENGYEHWQAVISLKNKEYFATVKNMLSSKAHIEPCKDGYFAAANYCSKEDTRFLGPWTEASNFILDPMEGLRLMPWQDKVIKIIKEPVHDRTIYWFWESVGGIGKSTFAKHLCIQYNAIYVNGKANDVKCAISFLIKNGQKVPIVIFDFPRTVEGYVSYDAIESIKNGIFFNSKYESGMVLFDKPHIFCFANFLPDTNKLSKDRWNIVNI
nr:MAG: replication associated protein [Cressdnaviricota sp.]